MTVIRPFTPPVVSSQPTSSAPVRSTAEARAAQRAFFQQALGDATPVRAAPVVTAPSTAQAAQAVREVRRPIPEEPPARVMRPGSFVDIKV